MMKIGIFMAGLAFLTSVVEASQLSVISRSGNIALVEKNSDDNSKTVVYPQIWTLRPWKKQSVVALNLSRLSGAEALSRNGRLVAFGCVDGTLCVFDARSGRLKTRFGHAQKFGHDFHYAVDALALSPDGKTLASVNSKGLFLWNWSEGRLLFSRPLRHRMFYNRDEIRNLESASAIQFSPDGRRLAIAGKTLSDENGHVFLLDVAHRVVRHVLDIDSGDGDTSALAFSPGGNRLLVVGDWHVSASSYDQAHLFDTRSGRLLWKIDNRLDMGGFADETDRFPDSAAFSSDGRRVAIGGLDRWSIKFLEIRRARNGRLMSIRTNKSNWPSIEVQKQLRAELNVR